MILFFVIRSNSIVHITSILATIQLAYAMNELKIQQKYFTYVVLTIQYITS